MRSSSSWRHEKLGDVCACQVTNFLSRWGMMSSSARGPMLEWRLSNVRAADCLTSGRGSHRARCTVEMRLSANTVTYQHQPTAMSLQLSLANTTDSFTVSNLRASNVTVTWPWAALLIGQNAITKFSITEWWREWVKSGWNHRNVACFFVYSEDSTRRHKHWYLLSHLLLLILLKIWRWCSNATEENS